MSERNRSQQPIWDSFLRGRASSTGSLASISENQQQQDFGSPQSNDYQNNHDEHNLRPRRSSIAMRFHSLRQSNAPNSFDNFARSFQRAAGFHEITPGRRGSISGRQEPDEEAAVEDTPSKRPDKSLLSQRLAGAGPQSTETTRADDARLPSAVSETTSLLRPLSHQPSLSRSRTTADDGGLGASFGTITSRMSASAQRRASILIQQQVEVNTRAREHPEDFKDEPVPERQVEVETLPDGEQVERIVGESTVPMTILNSTNVLIGVGILALPLALRYAGWVIGIATLTAAAAATVYTAQILAKCLDTNSASFTYGDIAFLAFDTWGRAIVEVLFILELLTAVVALIILVGDSMHLLIPAVSVLSWKVLVTLGLVPLNFMPFKILSFGSVLGIGCMIGIIVLVFVDGLIKPHSPGSIRHVAKTHAFPENPKTIPLSLGLVLAPWGGHSVFPAIYRDMRHPRRYPRAVKTTYVFTYGLDLTMAVLGYLMFGDHVRDEVTSNIIDSKAYPRAISIIVVVMIVVVCISKFPLSARPIMDTANKKLMVDLRQMDAKARQHSEKSVIHRSGRAATAVLVNLVVLGVSIAIPDFDSIMALMGSAFGFTISIILPVTFYLKIFRGTGQIGMGETVGCCVLIVVTVACAVLGTGSAIIPKEKLGLTSCTTLGCF